MPDIAEAPPPVVQSAPPHAQGDLRELLAAEPPGTAHPPADPSQLQKPEKTPQDAPKPKTATPTPPDKKNAPEAKEMPKKGRLEKLGKVEVPEEAKDEVKKDPSQTSEADQNQNQEQQIKPEQQTRWKELRAKEERLEKEVIPELEKTKAEIARLQSLIVDEKAKEKLSNLEQRYAEDLVRDSEEYKKNVAEPYQRQMGLINLVAKNAGLNEAQAEALLRATDLQDPFQRSKAMRNIISQGILLDENGRPQVVEVEDEATGEKTKKYAPLPQEDIANYLAHATAASNKLHEDIYPKDAEAMAKAKEISTAYKGKESQQSVLQREADQKAFNESLADVSKTLSTANLKPLFDDADLKIEGVTISQAFEGAKPAEEGDYQGRAYQALAGEALPFVVEALNKAKRELKEVKGSISARNGARPKTTDGTTPPAQDEEDPSNDKSGSVLRTLLQRRV